MRFKVVIQILGVSPAVSLFCGLSESQFKLQVEKNESNLWKPNLLIKWKCGTYAMNLINTSLI